LWPDGSSISLLLVAGGGFWNLGVLLGVGGILLGDSTGYQG